MTKDQSILYTASFWDKKVKVFDVVNQDNTNNMYLPFKPGILEVISD